MPAGAVTLIEIDLCFAPSIAMLSPGSSNPALPLFTVQWPMSFVGPGGWFGFLMWPLTIAFQILFWPSPQPVICASVVGRSFWATIEIVCGSSLGLPSYSNVSV